MSRNVIEYRIDNNPRIEEAEQELTRYLSGLRTVNSISFPRAITSKGQDNTETVLMSVYRDDSRDLTAVCIKTCSDNGRYYNLVLDSPTSDISDLVKKLTLQE